MIWIVIGFACLLIIGVLVLSLRRGNERAEKPRNSADRAKRKARLVQEAQHIFSAAEWKVVKKGNSSYDFSSSKSMITVSVFCVDKSDLYYVSRFDLLERLESDARTFFAMHYKVLIYYTNLKLDQSFVETAARSGLLLFTVDDIDCLLTTTRYDQELPGRLDARIEVIFERHQNVSLLLSRRFFDVGAQETAVLWAHRAIAARHLARVKFSQIFNHLKLIKDIDGAMRFGTEFCALHRTDMEAASAMIELCLSVKDYHKALELAVRLSEERPDDSAGYVSGAVAYEGLGNSGEALSWIKKAAAIAPSSQAVLEAAVQIARTAASPELEKQWSEQLTGIRQRAFAG